MITTFNNSEKLIKSLNSVISQKTKVDQIIIVDDCSTDNTNSLIKSITFFNQEYNSKIEYLKLPQNIGQVGAINSSINKVKSDILFFLDSGDTWSSDYIEEAIKVFNGEPEINLVYGQFRNTKLKTNILEPQNYTEVLKQGYLGITSAISIRSSLIDLIFPIEDFGFRNRNFDDFLCFKLAKIGRFTSLNKAILNYEWGNGNSSDDFMWVVRSNLFLLYFFSADIIKLLGYYEYLSKHLKLLSKNN